MKERKAPESSLVGLAAKPKQSIMSQEVRPAEKKLKMSKTME